jgi:methylenetetrahydrofolate reductase (NADPH)
MRISDMLARGRPSISFEFMAPRDETEVDLLERVIATLAGHTPDWVSVTYRVRTGEKTLELVTRIKRHYHIEAMAHLTCANSAERTRQILNWMEREGVANVLALRGDTQSPDQPYIPADPQLTHGSDLVAFVHPESPDLEHEFRYMKLKVEAGADFLITQLFFDNRFYFDLVARARAAGITVPIVPGLMPVPSRRSLAVMTGMSGATVPVALQTAIDQQPDDDSIRALGVQHCIAQCAELIEAGVPGLHFYTFNRARGPIQILNALRGQQLIAS